MRDKTIPKFDATLEKAVRDAAHEITMEMMTYFVEEGTTINERWARLSYGIRGPQCGIYPAV